MTWVLRASGLLTDERVPALRLGLSGCKIPTSAAQETRKLGLSLMSDWEGGRYSHALSAMVREWWRGDERATVSVSGRASMLAGFQGHYLATSVHARGLNAADRASFYSGLRVLD